MDSLANYGSDDDLDDSSDEISTTATHGSGRSTARTIQTDANYDEVQMSLSEDSGDESRDASVASGSKDDYNYRDKNDGDRYGSRDRDEDKYRGDRDRKADREDRDRRGDREDRERRNEKEDRDRYKDRDDDRPRERYRSDRDEDKPRDKRDDRREKSKERGGGGRDDRHRDRRDRDRRRSRSRDRRSRSPTRERRSRSRSRDRRSRSRSPRREDRFRGDRGGRPPYKRFERSRLENQARMAAIAKNTSQETNQDGPQDRFFMPGITGKYREQIEKRKLLWQKKDAEKPVAAAPTTTAPKATKVWEATTFAQDTDGKVANKFKRLMGIRNASEGKQPATEVLKKQEEMFSSMEQQYEVARTATHTMRGVGLGFGSFQR